MGGQDPAIGAVYLGVDVGSVTTKVVAVSPAGDIVASVCLETLGQPARQIMDGVALVGRQLHAEPALRIPGLSGLPAAAEAGAGLEASMRAAPDGPQAERSASRAPAPREVTVLGLGTTGSGRHMAAALAGGDVAKNEITAHAVAALRLAPGARTILEIGGQDSKIILLRDGMVTDFAMNTVCAAGTGSFLDRQAARLGLDIREFGALAARSRRPVRIAGRCTVFAETDMIHRQQVGHAVEDIVAGLCRALVRNYLNNLGKGKSLEPPYVFQGGVAANAGIVAAFEEALAAPVYVPPQHTLMGAYGAAILAQEARETATGASSTGGTPETQIGSPGPDGDAYATPTRFRGFDLCDLDYHTSTFDCNGCANQCEIVEIHLDGIPVARWGGRCERWERGPLEPVRRPAGQARVPSEERRGRKLPPKAETSCQR